MPKTQYYTATTIDGFIADDHNSLDWLFEVDENETAPPATTAPMVRPEAIRDRERRPMSSSSYSLPLGQCSDRGKSGSLVQADLARQIVGPRTHERHLVV